MAVLGIIKGPVKSLSKGHMYSSPSSLYSQPLLDALSQSCILDNTLIIPAVLSNNFIQLHPRRLCSILLFCGKAHAGLS